MSSIDPQETPDITPATGPETAVATEALPPVPEGRFTKRQKIMIALIALVVLVILVVGAVFAWYAVTRKPLSEVPVIPVSTVPVYSHALYDVTAPLGVAVDQAGGKVYATQSSGERKVAVFDMNGNKLTVLEPPGSKDALHIPMYVAVNPLDQSVWVSDRATATVYVYDKDGKFIKEFKPEGIKAWAPLALAFADDGTLYVTNLPDTKQNVLVFDKDGKLVQTFGENDKLSFPNGVQPMENGYVAVADSNNGRVLIYDKNGKLAGALARGNADSALGLPRGLTVDDENRLYVVDTINQVVRIFEPVKDSPIPVYSESFGQEGTIDGTFEYPNGIASDSQGRLYVADRANNRVQAWSY